MSKTSYTESPGIHVQRQVPPGRYAFTGWETVAVYRFQYPASAARTKDWLSERHPKETYRVEVVKPGTPVGGMAVPDGQQP